jgi:hypothetical protein
MVEVTWAGGTVGHRLDHIAYSATIKLYVLNYLTTQQET